MGTRVTTPGQPLGSWDELYSLAYSEVCVILESIFDGTIEVKDAYAHWLQHVSQHAYRRELLLIEVRKAYADLRDSRGQE